MTKNADKDVIDLIEESMIKKQKKTNLKIHEESFFSYVTFQFLV